MDIYCEYMVKRKKHVTDYVLAVILILVAAYFSLISFAMIMLLKSFTLLLVAAIWYGVFYLLRRKNIEYEYTLTNNTLDIDRIFGKTTRKRITTIDILKVDYIRPAKEADFEKNEKINDHYLCREKKAEDTYVLLFTRDDRTHRVFFTPSEKMKQSMQEINPSCVTIEG